VKENVYIISDLHLGSPSPAKSLIREKHVVKWLDSIQHDARALYLVGDVFDFWFEYRHAVPKGFVRFLGKLAHMADAGVEMHIFSGNHDLWYKDYLPSQFEVAIHHQPITRTFFGEKYYLAHGDGLGPGDQGYKLMKKVFTHPLSKWLFERLHPNFGIGLALGLSRNGGDHDYNQHKDQGPFTLNDPLSIHSKEILAAEPDYRHFIYGHRHALAHLSLTEQADIFVLGDWIHFFSYLKISAQGPELLTFPKEESNLSLANI